MKAPSCALAYFAPLALLAACGGSSDDGAPLGPSAPLSELPEVYASAICEAFANCAGPLFEIYRPGEDCASRVAAQLAEELGRIETAVEAGRIVYRGDRLTACADEIRGRSCSELLERDSALCMAALDGTVELGGTCSLSTECKGRAYCDFTDACPGTCRELQPAGGSCTSDGQCASGLVCSAETGRCVEPAGAGDLCEAGEPECEPGFLCAGADANNDGSGNCRTYDEVLAAGNGQACSPVAGELCDPDHVCVIQSADANGLVATCMPNVASGAACRAAFPDQCPDDEYCEIAPETLEGGCVPRPGPGEPCGRGPFETEGSICAANTRCNGGTCRELATLGENCSNDEACLSEHCRDGACISADSCE